MYSNDSIGDSTKYFLLIQIMTRQHTYTIKNIVYNFMWKYGHNCRLVCRKTSCISWISKNVHVLNRCSNFWYKHLVGKTAKFSPDKMELFFFDSTSPSLNLITIQKQTGINARLWTPLPHYLLFICLLAFL